MPTSRSPSNKQQTITVSAQTNIVTMCDTDRIPRGRSKTSLNASSTARSAGKISAVIVTHEERAPDSAFADEGAGLSAETLAGLSAASSACRRKPTAGERRKLDGPRDIHRQSASSTCMADKIHRSQRRSGLGSIHHVLPATESHEQSQHIIMSMDEAPAREGWSAITSKMQDSPWTRVRRRQKPAPRDRGSPRRPRSCRLKHAGGRRAPSSGPEERTNSFTHHDDRDRKPDRPGFVGLRDPAQPNDYVAKPCEAAGMMARIRSVLRRREPVSRAARGRGGRSRQQAAKDRCAFGTKWLGLEAQPCATDEGNEHSLHRFRIQLLRCLRPIEDGCCRARGSRACKRPAMPEASTGAGLEGS